MSENDTQPDVPVEEPEDEQPVQEETRRDRRARLRAQPVTLTPKTLRLLLILVASNFLVLIALGVALLRTSVSLMRQPPYLTIVLTPTPEATAPPAPTPTPFGQGGVIAFTLRQNGNADIYAINQTNREIVRLTSDPAEDRDPAWSPDGQMLAFASRRAGNWDIYLLDLEGGALIRLTRDLEFDGGPTWSPDGSRIAFEAYRYDNLDIFVMDADGRSAQRLSTGAGPDHSPVWSPDGSMIAFVSYRDGNQDIFVYVVEGEGEGDVINVTDTPSADESDPVWSPDGSRLAYTVESAGHSRVQVGTLEWQTEGITETQRTLQLSSIDLFGSGVEPIWAPDGQSVVTVYQHEGWSYLIASSLYGWGLSQEIYGAEAEISSPVWRAEPLSDRAIVRARSVEPESDPPLYTELVQPPAAEGPPHSLVALSGVNDSEDRAQLSERVDDSFRALRQRIEAETGRDFLAILGASWDPITSTTRPGQPSMSWNLCGRAIDVNESFYDRDNQLIQLVREEVGNETYWRVFIRALRQDGSMGEPLRVAPWDLKAREGDGLPAVQGGELVDEVPAGYYVDFTGMAADYGWERVGALYRWRYFWPDIQWWHFQKTDDLSWWTCMLELYEEDEIEGNFGSIPDDVERPE
jgi:TolB protein